VLNDTFRERDVISILMQFGMKPFDEAEGTTVAEYLCVGLEEVLNEFDDPTCEAIARECCARVDAGQSVGPDYWASHEDDKIRELAATVFSDRYTYSEGWWERFEIMLTTQKMPDENWLPAAKRSIIRFKLSKLLKKMDSTIERMRQAQQDNDEKTMNRLLKLFARMEGVKKYLSAELGSVVLR
jgi:DNA primase